MFVEAGFPALTLNIAEKLGLFQAFDDMAEGSGMFSEI